MPSSLVKIIGITGGIVTVGGGSTYLILNSLKDESKNETELPSAQSEITEPPLTTSFEKKKISDLLEGKVFLGKDEESGEWQTQWDKFKGNYASVEKPIAPWEFTNWKKIKDNAETIGTFKAQCEKNKDILVTNKDDSIFIEITKYCPTKQANARP